MNKKKYLPLIYDLGDAAEKIKNQENNANELYNACRHIDKYIKQSSNIAKTAFEIESICLEYDRDINLKKNINRIDSRLTGCLAAVKDLNDLQNQPKKYIADFLSFQKHNLDADTTYTKEAFNSLKYLGVEKNANYTNEAGYRFYEKRQDMLKQGREVFLKEKQQKFAKTKLLQQEKTNNLNKSKGLER